MSDRFGEITVAQPNKEYAVVYRMDGSEWVFRFHADNVSDAERRLYFIKLGAQMLGEVKGIYPYHMGWWCKAVVTVRNFFGR